MGDRSDENASGLEPALASVSAHSPGERRRLDPGLEVGDSFGLTGRLTVDRVLKALQQLLQVRDPRFKGTDAIPCGTSAAGRCWFAGCPFGAANLADPRDQPLTLAQAHQRTRRLGRAGRGGKRRRSSSVIWRITNEPLCTC